MKRFLCNILLFGVLLAVGFAGLEYYCRTLTDTEEIAYKARRIEEVGDSIDILVCGTSYFYWGIRPDLWKGKKVFNLATDGQHIEMQYYVLKSALERLSSLKQFLLQVSYCTYFEPPQEKFHYNSKWSPYTIYFHTEKYSGFSRYGAEIFNPPMFRSKIVPWRRPDDIYCGPFGNSYEHTLSRRPENWRDRAVDLERADTALKRKYKWKYLDYDRAYFKAILDLCRERGVEVIVVRAPAHHLYRDLLAQNQLDMTNQIIDQFQREYGFRFLDYFEDDRFEDDDFFDPSHLAYETGAAKWTIILSEDVEQSDRASCLSVSQ